MSDTDLSSADPLGQIADEFVEALRQGQRPSVEEFARRYPDRISSYVMLPLPHIDASLKEMERGFDELGSVGVNMNIVCLGRSIAETEFEPLYAEMNRRGAVLFVHPAGSAICSPFIIDYKYGGSVGTSLEDATFVLHVIAKQIPTVTRGSKSSCRIAAAQSRC